MFRLGKGEIESWLSEDGCSMDSSEITYVSFDSSCRAGRKRVYGGLREKERKVSSLWFCSLRRSSSLFVQFFLELLALKVEKGRMKCLFASLKVLYLAYSVTQDACGRSEDEAEIFSTHLVHVQPPSSPVWASFFFSRLDLCLWDILS